MQPFGTKKSRNLLGQKESRNLLVPNCSPMTLPTAAHAPDEGVVKHDQVHGDPGRTRPKERTYRLAAGD